ncbi:MAG TPA: hypothetical protein DEG71_10420 [Clostridiales bacterium]|nr:hypothetical protein [Clostridiales bacterium]
MIKLNSQTLASKGQIQTVEAYQEILDSFYTAVETLPNSREKALVITKIDEAALWLREALSKI